MQLPLTWCPHWLSAFCVACEHVLWVHARTLVCLASYYPDAALLDGASPPKAPRSAPSSPARLSRVIEAVREHNSKVPDLSKPRKRIGFRAHVVAGPQVAAGLQAQRTVLQLRRSQPVLAVVQQREERCQPEMARLDAQRVRDDEAPRPALVRAPPGLAHAAHERAVPEPAARGGAERGARRVVASGCAVRDARPVSYTHLTLPTICSV